MEETYAAHDFKMMGLKDTVVSGQNVVANSNKSTRHTDGIVSNDTQLPSQLQSNNWLSNKNMRSNMTESVVFSVSNNKSKSLN